MIFSVVLSLCIASSLAKPDTVHGPHILTRSPVHITPPIHILANHPVIALGPKIEYHHSDGLGSGVFGYSAKTSTHHSTFDAFGNKAGEFSYIKPDGSIHKTHYIADDEGYRVISNDLPIAPISAAILPIHIIRKRSVYGYTPAPVVTPTGHLADTPEVAAAKAAHFAEHAKLGNYHIATPAPESLHYASPISYSPFTRSGGIPLNNYPSKPLQYTSYTPSNPLQYNSYTGPIVTSDGYLQDTPEVAAAKSAHYAEKLKITPQYNNIQYNTAPINYPNTEISGRLYPTSPLTLTATHSGYTHVTPNGHIADTPEVTAAKAAHFAEHDAINARTAAITNDHSTVPFTRGAFQPTFHSFEYATPNSASFSTQYSPIGYQKPSPIGYNKPIPSGYTNLNSQPADTPEVAAAKAAHFAEYARVASRQKRSVSYETLPASTFPLQHSALAAPIPPPLSFPHAALRTPISPPLPFPHSTLAAPIHHPLPLPHAALPAPIPHSSFYPAQPFLPTPFSGLHGAHPLPALPGSIPPSVTVHGPHAYSYQIKS